MRIVVLNREIHPQLRPDVLAAQQPAVAVADEFVLDKSAVWRFVHVAKSTSFER